MAVCFSTLPLGRIGFSRKVAFIVVARCLPTYRRGHGLPYPYLLKKERGLFPITFSETQGALLSESLSSPKCTQTCSYTFLSPVDHIPTYTSNCGQERGKIHSLQRYRLALEFKRGVIFTQGLM